MEKQTVKNKNKSGNHFRALLKKNFIIVKRNTCCTLCEILLPIILSIVLIGIRYLSSVKTLNQTSYIQSSNPAINMYVKNYSSTPNTFNQTLASLKGSDSEYQRQAQLNLMKNCMPQGRYQQIAIIMNTASGSSPIATALSSLIVNKLKITPQYFNSVSAFEKYVSSASYGYTTNQICFGIQIDKDDTQGFQYHLRFNITFSMTYTDLYKTSMPRTQPIILQDLENLQKYQTIGFLAMQNWIDNLVLQNTAAGNGCSIVPTVTSMITEAGKLDNFSTSIQGSTNFFLVLPLIGYFIGLVQKLLYEKETRIREGMKMMGMSSFSFYLSWITTYIVTGLVIVILVTIIVTNQVITTVPFGMFLLLYLMLMLNLIFQALFIQVFFTRAKPGIIAAIVFFLLQYILIAFIGTQPDESTVKAVSLAPHIAFTFAVNTMLSFQTSNVLINFNNFDTMISNYSIKLAFQYMIVELVFWFILSIYLDQVFPNEFGQKKHPLFFIECLLNKQKMNSNKIENEENEKNENVEQPDNQMEELQFQDQVVKLINMRKLYDSGKLAVDNLSMTMYLNQIFVLLGHNGAGKTSTISILSGLLKYSSGMASVFGFDVNSQMEQIRQIMGVCPQHDILFDSLTVREHLELFSTFKGSDPATMSQEIDKMIQDLGLQEKTNELASSLSGGQKRRLSVGIAFIGNSKFIILDEPTSGMDTSARRHIWEMLKNYRSDRIILLTTHFMDEADNLGDRIAIMSHGQLKCCGSSVFLKNKFGVGYNLSIAKKSQLQTDNIYNFIKNINPKAVKVSDVSSEELYQLPTDTVNCFQQLFESLDANLQQLGIESYGISITTLEEVFLKVNDSQSKQKQMLQNNKQQQGEIELQNIDQKEEKKQDDYQKVKQEDKQILEIEQEYDFKESYLPGFKKFQALFKVLVWKRLMYFRRDLKGFLLEIVIPLVIIAFGCAILGMSFVAIQPSLLLDMNFYNSQSILYSGYSTINQDQLQSLMNFEKYSTDYYAVTSVGDNKQIAEWDLKVFNQKSRNTQGAFFITNLDINYAYILETNTISPEAPAVFMNLMNRAIIRMVNNNAKFILNCYNNPMPLTFLQQQVQQTASGIVASMIFSLALGFIPASIVVFIVKEREQKIKHQQLVSGVSIFSYWVSNYFVDYCKYLVYALVTVGIIKAYNISIISQGDNYDAIWTLHFINGFSMISFLYLFQFLFSSYSSAQVTIFVLYIICGTVFSIGIYILRFFPSTKDYAEAVSYFLRLFPCFTYGYSFINNSSIATFALIRNEPPKSPFAWINNGMDIFYMGITGFVYFLLVFVIEFITVSKKYNLENITQKKNEYVVKRKDSDVEKEEQIVEKSKDDQFAVKVDKLRKVYGANNKVAVDRVSFGIEQGNVFGLLGVNGAGKTTTFKMLTGDIISTSGNAYIYSHNIASDQEKVRQYIGYCPQFDALLENLTVKEHLLLYASIKCIPYSRQQDLVNQLIYKLDLERYKQVLSKDLSGGNKRKLSVAIAMLGNPPVIFLDEPSTGMDPEARRFMWTVISNISTTRKQSTVILTTHSMEEAEALCTKMAIMVNGQLQCLGNIQHIKSKYGQGYEIEVKLRPTSQQYLNQIHHFLQHYQYGQRIKMEKVQLIFQALNVTQFFSLIKNNEVGSHLYFENQNFGGILLENIVDFINTQQKSKAVQNILQEKFGKIIVIEQYSLFQRIKLINNQKVGKLFGFFIQNQEVLQIEQYSIKQTTIEQIFNQFAQNEIGFQLKNQDNLINNLEVENINTSNNDISQIEIK